MLPSRPSKDRVISRRRKRGNVRFRMRCGIRGERASPEQWRKRHVHVRQRGATWCADCRDAMRRRGRTDGWTAALREITSHARNDRETVTLLSPCLPDYPSSFPAILPPLSLRGIRVSRRPPSCPLADVGQPPVSPPYPASDRSPSSRCVHASGRPTITFPREHRRETTSKDFVRFRAFHSCIYVYPGSTYF